MKLAFCLFKYFPYGGLQRDFLRIARACRDRGHEVHVYTMDWKGETEAGLQVHLMKVDGWQNHRRSRSYAEKLRAELGSGGYDLTIGFNKMPYLDIYYAADVCYQARMRKTRRWFYRLTPRYRHHLAFEEAVFARGQATEIMLISPLQQREFVQYYQTETERFHLLPPGITKDRIAPPDAVDIRKRVRKEQGIPNDHILLLMVGSGFKTKGLDRAIRGFASLNPTLRSRCHLFVIGQDNPRVFKQLARQLNVEGSVRFLGGRSDVPHFLLAADLLLHPAYHENTGTVLLEAIASGLPVLTVDICGYAHYVSEAKAGLVLSTPFQQAEFNAVLDKMILSSECEAWRQQGLAWSKQADIYNMPEQAADLIENVGRKRDLSKQRA